VEIFSKIKLNLSVLKCLNKLRETVGRKPDLALRMTDRLSDLADSKHDAIGLSLEDDLLPQRIRQPKKPSDTK